VGRAFAEGIVMSDELKAMLELVRDYRMTPEEKRDQEIDFAFGNVHYENSRVTREMVAGSIPMSTTVRPGPLDLDLA
jgi:hypothetical protein